MSHPTRDSLCSVQQIPGVLRTQRGPCSTSSYIVCAATILGSFKQHISGLLYASHVCRTWACCAVLDMPTGRRSLRKLVLCDAGPGSLSLDSRFHLHLLRPCSQPSPPAPVPGLPFLCLRPSPDAPVPSRSPPPLPPVPESLGRPPLVPRPLSRCCRSPSRRGHRKPRAH